MKKINLSLLFAILLFSVISCKKENIGVKPGEKNEALATIPILGNVWTQLGLPVVPGPPSSIEYNISFSANDKVYAALVGNNQLWEFDPATAGWTLKKNPFFNFTVFTGGSSAYRHVFTNGDNIYFLNATYKNLKQYNLVTGLWSNMANFPGTALYGVNAAYTVSKGYVMAGATGADANGYAYTVAQNWEYDFASNTWTAKANTPGFSRYNAASFALGDKIYYGTGLSTLSLINPITHVIYRSPLIDSDWWEFNTTTNTWAQKTAFGGGARQDTRGFVIGSKVYLGLGSAGYFTDLRADLWSYDPNADAWAQRASYPPGNGYPPYISMVGAAGHGYAVTQNITAFWRYTAPYTILNPGIGNVISN